MSAGIFAWAGSSDVGSRSRNEDRYAQVLSASGELAGFALADGLGGHDAGDVAAQVAVDGALGVVREAHGSDDLAATVRRALEAAHAAVLAARAAAGEQSDMATTICLAVSGSGRVAWGHVGDSRIYRIRNGRATRLTRDHSVAESLRALARTPAERAAAERRSNELLSSLGNPAPLFDVSEVEALEPGDVFLLCSDGLWAHASERVLAQDWARAANVEEWLGGLHDRVKAGADANQDNFTALAFVAPGSRRAATAARNGPNPIGLLLAIVTVALAFLVASKFAPPSGT